MPENLPQDLVIEIMSCVYNFKTLQSCLQVSRSWRDATVPKLTLKSVIAEGGPRAESLQEPANTLFQFVKRYRIESDDGSKLFTPKRYKFSHFYAFKDLRELAIECLDLSSFMPELEKYFGRLAPTLRSLTLHEPRASPQQMLSLIMIFKHLQDA